MEIDPYANTPSFKGQRLQFSTDSPLVPSLIAANLPSSFDPATVYASRFQSKQILLENPVKESKYATTQKQKKARREKLQQRKETGVMGRNEAKRRSIWNLQKGAAKYHLFLPIHHLWLGYMAELFNLPSPPTDPSEPPIRVPSSAVIHQKLIKADYHGCIITVKDSKCTSLIGHTGIVVHETENTFKIVTIDDKFKVIPKRNVVFKFRIPIYALNLSQFTEMHASATNVTSAAESKSIPVLHPLDHAPSLEFELYGNQFRYRAADRATKKFKSKETIEFT